jgi:hypothetical protein
MSEKTFLFHTMLDELIPGVTWRDDHAICNTTANLQAGGHMATLEWVWPVGENGQTLDCLDDDCRPMVNRVLDTFNRHVANGRVKSVTCYMAPRKSETAVCDPGWLEWGVVLRDEAGERVLYIAHIQRRIGADVERHT